MRKKINTITEFPLDNISPAMNLALTFMDINFHSFVTQFLDFLDETLAPFGKIKKKE